MYAPLCGQCFHFSRVDRRGTGHAFLPLRMFYNLLSDTIHCELCWWWRILYSHNYSWVLFWNAVKLRGKCWAFQVLWLSFVRRNQSSVDSRSNSAPIQRQNPFEYFSQCPKDSEIFPPWVVVTGLPLSPQYTVPSKHFRLLLEYLFSFFLFGRTKRRVGSINLTSISTMFTCVPIIYQSLGMTLIILR